MKDASYGIMQNSKPFIQGWDFNPHLFVVYFGQYLKPKRAWIQVLSGAFLVVCLKFWITLIFIVFILLLFCSWEWMENSLRPLNLGVRKKKLFFSMIQLVYKFANNDELNGLFHNSKIQHSTYFLTIFYNIHHVFDTCIV